MRPVIAFVLCLLIVRLSYCQDSLPRKIILDGDTLIVLSPSQLDRVIELSIDGIQYKQANDSLLCKITVQDSLIDVRGRIINNLNDQLSTVNVNSAYKDTIISKQEIVNANLYRDNRRLATYSKYSTGLSLLLLILLIVK